MPTIRNERYEITCADDGSAVSLLHRPSGERWLLDPKSCLAGSAGEDIVMAGEALAQLGEKPVARFETGTAAREGNAALLVIRRGQAGEAAFRYELADGGVRVTLLADRSTVTAAVLPGAFRPEGIDAPPVVLPKNQGVWHRGTGDPFHLCMRRDGHMGWSMPFFGVVGTRQALLTIIEEEADAAIWFEKDDRGRVRTAAVANPSLGRLAYDRSVLLQCVEPDATATALAYRRYVRERGRFVSWEEKLDARPLLERLFGALMCFIGYCRNDAMDYAENFTALKRMGFDKAFIYPTSFGTVQQGFLMGGLPPVDIRRHLPLLDDLGYLAASWMWLEDIPYDYEALMLNAEGKEILSWKIDDQRWYRSCPRGQVPISHRIQDAHMAGHTAHHFDVTASRAAGVCHHPDHALDRRGDELWRRKVLETAMSRGLVVSSEGYWGSATGSYDIGSVKIPEPVHADWYTVPLTSLVYHDSCIHDWWEVDNYNNMQGHGHDQPGTYFPLRRAGQPEMQAAQDALAGCPPNVFPFGSQYGWVSEVWGESFSYTFTLDDPGVRHALRVALPVARLHGRIGKVACVAHRTLAEDGSLQTTAFADGTRVAANFAAETREVEDFGRLDPMTWKVIPG